MYAQLCKRLANEAPSFEKDPTHTICTFLRLLINICRDKFNTRFKRDTAESDSQFNKVHRPYQAATENDADEEERRHLAKQRMLGNVKFIGELNKLDMLAKNVLHQCIEEMLDKKKKRSTTKEEMCEDMECLAQLLKTCGKNLDSEQGKELMNQYFEKLERRSKSTDYPPRIRFMLKDVIELRENNWIPRKVATIEGPVPIKQIRSDDEPLIRTPFVNRNRDMRNNRDDRENNNWMSPFPFNLQSGGFNEYSPCVSATGSSTISHFYTSSMGHNRSYGNNNNRDRNSQNNNQNNSNHRFNKLHGGQSISGNGRDDRIQQRDQSNSQYNSNNHMNNNNNNNNNSGNNNKELAPRFKRNLITTHQDPVENLQMRPAANSLLFKVKSNQHQKFPPTLPILTAPTATNSSGNSINSAGNINHNNNNNMQLPNTQYPSLNTPISHLTSQPNLRLAGGKFNDNNENHKVNQSSNSNSNSNSSGGSSSHLIDKTATKFSGMRIISPMNQDHQEVMGNLSHNKKPLENGVNEDYGNSNNSMPPPLITKHGSIEKVSCTGSGAGGGKQAKKEKSVNKEEVLKKAATFVKDHFFCTVEENSADGSADDDKVVLNELVSGFLELKVPEKCMKDVGINMILDVLEKGDEFYLNRLIIFLQALRKQANLKPNMFFEIFRQVVNKVNEREALNPRITAHLASLLSKATVGEGSLLKLNDIANFTDNGQYYPLFLLVLQHQHKTIGKAELEAKFYASKIDLMNCLPEVDRTKARLAEILDDRSLTFLYPLLKVQAEMSRQIANDSNPATFLKWIKTNVESKHYNEEGFINALMTVIVKYVTAVTTLADGVDVKTCPDKSVQAKEESLLCKYCRILQTFLDHRTELQLIAIYALQVFCYNHNFPRGLLCRWFKYMYDFEVIDEEAFILWKEDIPDKYPGKCTALCQVNKWFTWLQEAESEDD